MPLSCANSCRYSRNHCEDAQELDNQALNQVFFESKLACVFQGPKHALQALYAKKEGIVALWLPTLQIECRSTSCFFKSPKLRKEGIASAASRETSNSSPHYIDPNTAPQSQNCVPGGISLRQVLTTVSTTIHTSIYGCLCLRSGASNGRAKTVDGQIKASIRAVTGHLHTLASPGTEL